MTVSHAKTAGLLAETPGLPLQAQLQPAAKLVPEWHGRYQARRESLRSDPALLRFMIGMVIAGLVGAAILMTYFLVQDIKQSDRVQVQVASQRIAMSIEDIMQDVETNLEALSPALTAYSLDADQMSHDERREQRRQIFRMIDDSPIAGLAIFDPLGDVTFEIGKTERSDLPRWVTLPVEPGSQLIDRRIEFVRMENSRAVHALFVLPEEDRFVAAIIDNALLVEALTPEDAALREAYLHDHAGRVLAASDGAVPLVSAPAGLDAADARIESAADPRIDTQASSIALNVANLNVTAIAPPITVRRFLHASGGILLSSLGLAALCLGLLIYVIQTEWKKRDRRASLDEDTVARSEIAADILGAGIIDWRVSDAVIAYSEGWQRLFSADLETGDEEIYDWIDKMHPDSQNTARNNYQALLEGQVFEIHHEIAVRRRDGRYTIVRERGRARLDATGRASRIVLVQRKVREE